MGGLDENYQSIDCQMIFSIPDNAKSEVVRKILSLVDEFEKT